MRGGGEKTGKRTGVSGLARCSRTKGSKRDAKRESESSPSLDNDTLATRRRIEEENNGSIIDSRCYVDSHIDLDLNLTLLFPGIETDVFFSIAISSYSVPTAWGWGPGAQAQEFGGVHS